MNSILQYYKGNLLLCAGLYLIRCKHQRNSITFSGPQLPVFSYTDTIRRSSSDCFSSTLTGFLNLCQYVDIGCN